VAVAHTNLSVKGAQMMTHIRTAEFPVAGMGTRFSPATKSIPKEELPRIGNAIEDRSLGSTRPRACLKARGPDS